MVFQILGALHDPRDSSEHASNAYIAIGFSLKTGYPCTFKLEDIAKTMLFVYTLYSNKN